MIIIVNEKKLINESEKILFRFKEITESLTRLSIIKRTPEKRKGISISAKTLKIIRKIIFFLKRFSRSLK